MSLEVLTPNELTNMDPVFGQLSFDDHEQRYRFKSNYRYS